MINPELLDPVYALENTAEPCPCLCHPSPEGLRYMLQCFKQVFRVQGFRAFKGGYGRGEGRKGKAMEFEENAWNQDNRNASLICSQP